MARSLIRQLEQIRRAATYDDAVVDVNLASVAEPTISGSLEEDTNVIRTIVKQLKGSTNWYDAPDKYFDPTDTDAISTENKDATLANFSGNTLDAKTIIVAVSDDNYGNGHTISGTMTGTLLSPVTTNYADPVNRLGLPIFESVANSGSYYDEGGSDNVCRVDVIDASSDTEFTTTSGHTVYAKFHDGADFGGTGEGNDVYVRLYANNTVIDSDDLEDSSMSLKFVYPVRKRLSDMQEYEWLRTDFVSSWEGDVELIEDISNLWSYTGSGDGVDTTTGTWTNTTASYLLQSDPSSLQLAVDLINDGVGSRQYTESNYISDGSTITNALDSLDQELADLADSIAAGVGEKYIESVASTISKNVPHTLPYSVTYTPEDTAGREGKNMDVYVDGQLLAADTGTNGANADRDYGETSTTSVTFRFNIQIGRNITYVVRQ